MFSKLGLAAAVIAVGSFATVDLAEARRGDGAHQNLQNSAANGAKHARKANRKNRKNNGMQNNVRRNGIGNRRRNTQTTATSYRQGARPNATYVPQAQLRRKKKKKGWKKFARIVGGAAIAYATRRQNDYIGYDNYVGRELPRHGRLNGDFRDDRWSQGRGRLRNRYQDNRCVAVAKRRGGYGRRIGIRSEGFGRRACRKAMRRCESRLYNERRSFGRNPYAACVVARRR